MEKRICTVKVIVNPSACKSVSMRYELSPKQNLHVKLMLQNVNDLSSVVDELRKQIVIRHEYSVRFNLTNVPSIIKENKKFQDEILDLFKFHTTPTSPSIPMIQTVSIASEKLTIPEVELNILATELKERIKTYGANPDLKNVYTTKGKQKIYNYVKTSLARPNINLDDALAIANLAII